MIKLREYQSNLKQEVYHAWQNGLNNILMVLPTGMGKTKTFCTVAKEMAFDSRMPTAIVVHRKELVQQISLTLSEEEIVHNLIAPRNVIKDIISAQRDSFNKQFYDYNAIISVVSVDTLNSRAHKHDKWCQKIKFWIVDEAAHVLKENKWGKALDLFPNAQRGLGVTATPERLDKKGLGSHVDGVFDAMVEGPPTRWGMKQGYLCDYKIAIPHSDYNNFLKKAGANADYSKQAMIEASNKSHIVGDVVVNYIKFAKGKRAIYFATDIATAGKMEEAFKKSGVRAKLLTGTSTDRERFIYMKKFRDRELEVLINVDLFDEGLDVPGIECVGMARPTMSLAKYLQMWGRGLRPAEGKSHLILIDHVGNVKTHGLPDDIRSWTLDRIGKKKPNSLMRICRNPDCASPFSRALTECPYCGFESISIGTGGGGRIPPEMVDGDLTLIDSATLREMYSKTVLEDPAVLAARVSKAAGGAAGLRAMNNQVERIETQRNLARTIALWAGRKKNEGYGDREIHKHFFLTHGKTISEALSEPKADMAALLEQIN